MASAKQRCPSPFPAQNHATALVTVAAGSISEDGHGLCGGLLAGLLSNFTMHLLPTRTSGGFMAWGSADGLANYGTLALYDCVVTYCGKVRFGMRLSGERRGCYATWDQEFRPVSFPRLTL